MSTCECLLQGLLVIKYIHHLLPTATLKLNAESYLTCLCSISIVSEGNRDGCAEGSGERTHGTHGPDHILLLTQEEGTVNGIT